MGFLFALGATVLLSGGVFNVEKNIVISQVEIFLRTLAFINRKCL